MEMEDPSSTIVPGLWNENVKETYGEKYYDHILEQYKLYVDGANKYVELRASTNTFYLTLNTLILGIIGFGVEKLGKPIDNFLVVPFFFSALIICVSWFITLRAIRQANNAKYKVIGEFERRLPASPIWSAEWKALGEGKDAKLYVPQVNIERYIPLAFMLLYLALFVFILIRY